MATVTFRTPKNNAYGTLSVAIDADDTSVVLTSGQGARFPASDFWATLFTDDPGTGEIVLCSSRSTDTLTVTRAQQSTSAQAWAAGTNVQLLITAQALIDLHNALTDGTDELNVGALTVNGAFTLGAGAVNTNWSAWIPATEMMAAKGSPALAATSMYAERVIVPTWALDPSTDEGVCFTVGLPDDYDGRALSFDLHWTATDGTGGDVYWAMNRGRFDDDETLNQNVGGIAAADTFLAQKDLHVITISLGVPTGSGTKLFTGFLRRLGSHALDTFNADVLLIGGRLYYT